jgi:hypothetical protein
MLFDVSVRSRATHRRFLPIALISVICTRFRSFRSSENSTSSARTLRRKTAALYAFLLVDRVGRIDALALTEPGVLRRSSALIKTLQNNYRWAEGTVEGKHLNLYSRRGVRL